MIYKLSFTHSAEQEWKKLDNSVKNQFKKILEKRLNNPVVPKDKMRDTKKECYKIKLRTSGFRLVYVLLKEKITIVVISVGKRENNEVYNSLNSRIDEL